LNCSSDDEIAALTSSVKPVVRNIYHSDSPVKHDDSIEEEDIESLTSSVKSRTRLRRLDSLDDITQERENKLRQLRGMGFNDHVRATEALAHTNNNVEAAVDWLLAATCKGEEESSEETEVIAAPASVRNRTTTQAPKMEDKRARDEPAPAETELEKLIQKCEEYSKRLGSVITTFMTENENGDTQNSSTQMERQPKMLQRDLKDYQLIGMNWLYTLHKEGLNGILADESKCSH